MTTNGKGGSPEPIRCEWSGPADSAPILGETASRLYRHHGNYRWEGVSSEPYKAQSEDWAAARRMVFVGRAAEPLDFHLRYFELEPGGFTSLEKHEHAHVVIVVRGKGTIVAGTACWNVGFLDTVYIAPFTPHQLLNAGEEPFGFFCIVDAVRDRPQPLSPSELQRLLAIPTVRAVLRVPAIANSEGEAQSER
ncbi:MAG: cupin domain-containing protein [Blastocatellia bacterium]|nr:cupin domain-containing protein [Blastocatellia bacterium]MCS7157246.1 cupin domain-containing protein [Blastocatellia bacterium]MCX7752065.1 cupin domain-containing protein [Blastocatellia bacterium]MDW8167171.1 cupin domain-containing protein [Acidobacteriota bacterium]MDW8256496.1 cupin domain-containing protein [Acidobacteriota bacterium]